MPPRPRRKPAPRQSPNLAAIIGDAPGATETLNENPPTMPKPVQEDTPTEPIGERKTSKPRAGTLESRLAEAFSSAALIPSFTGDQYSAFIIASRSGKFAHDLAELAKVNSRLKKTLEGLLDGGAYGGVMFSGMALLLPILWSYGVIPAPPIDPFSALYPAVPPGVVPKSAQSRASQGERQTRRAPVSGNGGEGSGAVDSPGPFPAPGNNGSPPGVVTVKPGMVPPSNPAATQ